MASAEPEILLTANYVIWPCEMRKSGNYLKFQVKDIVCRLARVDYTAVCHSGAVLPRENAGISAVVRLRLPGIHTAQLLNIKFPTNLQNISLGTISGIG